MFLAKAPDEKMIKNPSLPGGIHYWIVGKTKSKKPHLVAIRTTHWVDPKSEGYLNRGDGILLNFGLAYKGHPTLVLRGDTRTSYVNGHPLNLEDFTKVKKLSPCKKRKVEKFLNRKFE